MGNQQDQNPLSRTERIAIHEAGHGVLYAVLFQNLRNFRLIFSAHGDDDGPRLNMDHKHSLTEKEAINLIAVGLGGKKAELIKYGTASKDEAYKPDNEMIKKIIEKSVYFPLLKQSAGRSEREIMHDIFRAESHYMTKAGNIAQQTLEYFWPAVEKVANRLMIRDVVSGDEIHNIVGAHITSSKNKPINEPHL